MSAWETWMTEKEIAVQPHTTCPASSGPGLLLMLCIHFSEKERGFFFKGQIPGSTWTTKMRSSDGLGKVKTLKVSKIGFLFYCLLSLYLSLSSAVFSSFGGHILAKFKRKG